MSYAGDPDRPLDADELDALELAAADALAAATRAGTLEWRESVWHDTEAVGRALQQTIDAGLPYAMLPAIALDALEAEAVDSLDVVTAIVGPSRCGELVGVTPAGRLLSWGPQEPEGLDLEAAPAATVAEATWLVCLLEPDGHYRHGWGYMAHARDRAEALHQETDPLARIARRAAHARG